MRTLDPILIKVDNAGPLTGDGNNTYLITSGNRACLIDAGTGSETHIAAIADQLHRLKARLGDVLVTHDHADHAAGIPRVFTAFERPTVAMYNPPAMSAEIAWRRLADGDEIVVGDTRLVALHTPGHAPDHLVFWHEDTRTVFTGDLVHPAGSALIVWSRGGDVAAYLASVERVLALDPARLLPGHGDAIHDPARLLRATLDHRLRREAEVLDAVERGRDTVPAIVDSIYDGLDPALRPAAGENVRAHLEKLKHDGLVTHADDRWRPRR